MLENPTIVELHFLGARVRGLFYSILTVVLLLGVGFILFTATLPRPALGTADKADGVVVYTGVGGQRIAAGMALLEQGAGERLLISGVNPQSRESLAALWPGDPADFECCVDLGFEAKTTVGNAREVGEWAARNGFSRIILVTSDYHMPRALLQTGAEAAHVEIFAWPVQSGYLDAQGRPASVEGSRQLALEYFKYLAVRLRTLPSAFKA
jgi:uncharacterized SAM-binding protein YcdF (DUF218 family)